MISLLASNFLYRCIIWTSCIYPLKTLSIIKEHSKTLGLYLGPYIPVNLWTRKFGARVNEEQKNTSFVHNYANLCIIIHATWTILFKFSVPYHYKGPCKISIQSNQEFPRKSGTDRQTNKQTNKY